MSMPTKNDVLTNIASIDLGSLGLTADDVTSNVQFMKVAGSDVIQVVLDVPPSLTKEQINDLQNKVQTSLAAIAGGAKVNVILSAHKAAPAPEVSKCSTQKKAQQKPIVKPKGVKSIIAVASGKGGVGKSLVSVNLALSLAYHHGLKVGLMDADIQGPSVPHLMGMRGSIEQNEDGLLIPNQQHGISTVSMGYMMEKGQAAIWRSPMMHQALDRMLHGVEWGECDVLVIDTPPGTGDVQLSLNSHIPMDGAVIVSTPQEIALADARRGISLFEKMNVPILGMVENMSAPTNGNKVFGSGGAEEEAKRQNIDFIGRIPFDYEWARTSDEGAPIMATDPNGDIAAPFRAMASKLVPRLRLS